LKLCTVRLDKEFVAVEGKDKRSLAMVFVREVCKLYEYKGYEEMGQILKGYWKLM